MRGLLAAAVGGVLILAVSLGCGSKGDSGAASASQIAVLDSTRLDSLIRNRDGRPLVLNVWATWCAPCREEFPDLIRASREFPEVDFVALSVDYPEELEKKVVPFVREMRVPFPVFVQDFDRQEDLINRLDPDWMGAIPATFVFDAKGELRAALIGKQSYQEFQAAVTGLLNTQSTEDRSASR